MDWTQFNQAFKIPTVPRKHTIWRTSWFLQKSIMVSLMSVFNMEK